MKKLSLFIFIALSSCQAQPPVETLEAEALKTGDWSEVDRRAEMKERMEVAPDLKCPEHLMRICVKDGEHEECSCQSRN